MNNNPYIQIQNVSKSFGETKAIENIDLSIAKGELFGFIGPDGAGKTTLFRIIASLLLANTGSVQVDHFDVVKDYKEIRHIIGYMPGRFSLYHDLTVEENLKFYATIFGTSIDQNYDLVKDIYSHIEPFKKRQAGKLSGGMKQKLALSCALIHKPELLILDEPTTGVDAVSRVEFWDMLQKLKETGITILVSTPYMDEAQRCDRVALMQEGSIMKIDKPSNIIDDFGHKLFSVKSDNIYQLLKDLRIYNQTYSVFPFGQELHLILQNNDLSQLKDFLQQKGHQNISIIETRASIEDCFMDLMVSKESI